ncbi:PAAR domain-containing protein [Xanthomonas oryzae pv. oryzicola]|uniref:PAAR domain-containing protein n=1 Tax=Xanthomonas oryzae TaxID=347 RepID=UPI0009EB7473|nr:PAAR domain-containing protein [Xanthomonas oryzae]
MEDAMARMIIVVGDRTTGGGTVVSGSLETDIDGMPVARLGDRVTCRKHPGVHTIVTGDITLMIEGQPVARHGDRLSCGCQLLSGRQDHAYFAQGAGVAEDALIDAVAKPASSGAVALADPADKGEVCEQCLRAGAARAAAMLGR